ncbi:ankyrin repeat domain-containing protein [Burkholderia cepacia]|uniref:Ankyrin repeat domain-containing protein n=2 Tax=Burkholderia cepacia TaxID=292 RepID=A0AAX2RQM3_BURCE|nr:ankyrin repeat domain-containing protein [Burkholderia cepacia]TES97286.1 ankyrin repeat domain-containing protein [Burkholderia cepacia]TEU33177.1 ankyrin repeat domain-containing protein [Burkholderia cepacia]TEU39920.1 ankyrin repeat domain-containing protein [Burkholderia cepacia]TEU47075.1 ankyrin repeat domain-containing protein [Burkholderia cepacia]
MLLGAHFTLWRGEATVSEQKTAKARPLSPLLKMAASSGVHAAVRLRLNRGDDVNATDGNGRTALHLAATRGHLQTCRVLLDAGIDLAARNRDGEDARALALAGGHVDVVALIDTYQNASNVRATAAMTQSSTGHTVVTEVPSEHGVRIKLRSAWRRYIE